MSNDEPVVEYIDDLDNDVAAYYYSDEEADPLLKQKENQKNTNKSVEDSNVQNTPQNNNSFQNKINTPKNNNLLDTSAFVQEAVQIEDGELDENDFTEGTKGKLQFSKRSARNNCHLVGVLTVAIPASHTTTTTTKCTDENAAKDKLEQTRVDILGFLSDTTKTNDKAAVVSRLVEYFDEPRSDLLNLAVEHLEVGQLTALVLEATTIEQNGGMYTADNNRKRTFGGVFFYIMSKKVSKEAKKAIFGADQKHRKQAQLQRQRKQKLFNNRGVKRRRENDADPEKIAKKQKSVTY